MRINTRWIGIINYAAAACWYVGAILGFINDKSFAIMYLCLGSAFLCLGSANMLRWRKETEQGNAPDAEHTQIYVQEENSGISNGKDIG